MLIPAPSLTPAHLAFAPDGTLVSEAFGDIYHSADGGPGQAQHVFLHGNGLPEGWRGKPSFVVLENGFGTGLNFLATWAAWRADPQRPQKLHYLATEMHPFQADDLARLHRQWPELGFLAAALRNAWPVLMSGFHRLEFAAGRVVLTLLLGDAETSLRTLRASVDAFYLDGFDPNKNPQMWSASLLRRCAQLAAREATFATWCVAGQVRRALSEAGFVPEKRPGFGRKRQMLAGKIIDRPGQKTPIPAATIDPATKCFKSVRPGPVEGHCHWASTLRQARGSARTGLSVFDGHLNKQHAVVIGAGLAGCAIAERLAARGWRVDLLDRHAEPAGEASGNLAGIVRPLLSRDDNLASRLNRACFLHLERNWRRLDQAGFPPRRNLNGILQIARDDAHQGQQREWLAMAGYPETFARFLDQAAASQNLGAETVHGGWWFPDGGWASPPSVCRAWLGAGGVNIRFRGGIDVARLQQVDGRWRLHDASGRVVAEAAVVIFASGAQATADRLAQTVGLPILPMRGQVSHLAAGTLPALAHAACCEGYLTPAVDGVHCLGASYSKATDADPSVIEHAENLARLARILPGTEQTFDANDLPGRVGFRATTPDHLPLVGALPDLDTVLAGDFHLKNFPRHAGLYGLLGLGSRGLVWSALLAECLASQINGEPLPLENNLVDAIDPARFALRALRRGG